MSAPKMGSRWKLVRHPNQPICKVTGYDMYHAKVDVTWEKDLIPKHEKYPEISFTNGDFLELDDEPYGYSMYGGGTHYCYHEWVKYEGAREAYEFCKKCDARKEEK